MPRYCSNALWIGNNFASGLATIAATTALSERPSAKLVVPVGKVRRGGGPAELEQVDLVEPLFVGGAGHGP